MTEFLSSDFWASIKNASRSANKRSVAVAYFTQDWLFLKKGDLLITDATNGAIKSGQTNAELLAKMFRRGVNVYSLPALHAKVAVLDGYVFVSSANLSASSASDSGLIEAGIVTDVESIRRAALAFIQQLQTKAVRIDQKFISRILRITPERGWNAAVEGANSGIKPVRERSRRYWILHTVPTDDPEDKAERDRVSKGEKVAKTLKDNPKSSISWVRWPASSRFAKESKRNDNLTVVAGQDNETGHATVGHHARILHKVRGKEGTYVYYEPSLHREKHDLRKTDFRRLAKKARFELSPRKETLTKEQSRILDENWPETRHI